MNLASRTAILLSILACLFVTPLSAAVESPAAAASEPAPVTVLREMSEHIQDVVRKDTSILKDPVRLRALAYEAVLPNVDFVALSRWVLGKHWRTATPQQREAFMDEFREMLMLNYLNQVTTYRETVVHFLPLRSEPQDEQVVVQAEVEPEGAPLINVLFRMHRVDDRWLIYDVAVEGISLVATHRSGFSQEISRHGMDGLIARLAERNHAGHEPAAEGCAGC